MTDHKSIRRKFIISGLVLLIFALGFNALLSLSALEKLYLQSVSSKYAAVGKRLQRNLENSLRFGKKIERFFGMERLLEETKKNLLRKIDPESPAGNEIPVSASDYDISVSVSLPDGTLCYSTDKNLIGTKLPEQFLMPGKSGYRRCNENYIVSLPVRGQLEKDTAFIVIGFGKKQVRNFLKAAFIRNIRMIGVIFVSSAILLMLAFNIIMRPDLNQLSKFKIYFPLLLIIGISQILFNVLNSSGFKNYYLEISKEKASVLAMLLKEDIEYYLSRGIRIHKLVKMDERMGEFIAAAPELDSMIVADRKGHPLYIATKNGVMNLQKTAETAEIQGAALKSLFRGTLPEKTHPEYRFILKILKNDQIEGYISAASYQGIIAANISKQVLFAKLKEITLDSGTVLVISFLFFAELLILVLQFIQKPAEELTAAFRVSWQAMRPAAFLFVTAYSIASSFIPLHMENLYKPVFGLSRDIVMGLPLSARNFCAGIAIVISGTWLDRRGWHEPFLAGLFLISAAFLYCWAAPSAIHFVLSMGLAGMGYGLSLMASQGFVIAHTGPENKAQGLSQLFAGVYAGAICGSSAGGMLAERLGYGPVFLIGSLTAVSVAAYTLLFMRRAMQKPGIRNIEKPAGTRSSSQLLRFLSDRNVFSVILFSTIAAEIAGVGFINYFSPVYLSRLGASESAIGRVFMINGLCFIYIAPFISKYADASENKKMYIVIGGILGGLGFVSFYFSVSFLRGMLATSLTVLLIGISAAFADSSRSSYVLKLQAAQELGAGKAMGVLSSSARIGQVLGPVVFGLMVTAGMNKGILFLGTAYLFATFLFFLAARKDRGLKIEN